jgi:hypothetical protein
MGVFGFLPHISLPFHKNWDLEFEGNFFYYDIHKMDDLYFLGPVITFFSSLSRKDGVRCLFLAGEGSVMIAPAKNWRARGQIPLSWEISILQDFLVQVQACSLTSVEGPH